MRRITGKSIIFAIILITLISTVLAQTRITPPKNPYPLAKDVELGQQAANEVEKKMPLLNDRQLDRYIERIGNRLLEGLPQEYAHSEFRYSFRVVNAKDINAFALPGGFTFVNRGLIEAASNEGELAGVMAHEISHVALRHGTAQAAKAQKYALGAAAGQVLGAIIGGAAGGAVAQGSQLGVGAYFLRFSRDYERQADLLGAQMMARAGYDPRDLANMFRTIERESNGKGGPEWLSSHPNPGNRYDAINREAQSLEVRNPIRETDDFDRAKARLREAPNARSRDDIARSNRRYPDDNNQLGSRVNTPSPRLREYRGNRLFQLEVPDNWRDLPSDDTITFAPNGAYGELDGRFIFTHGLMVGVTRSRTRDLRNATDEFLRGLTQGNPNLRQQSNYQRSNISGRDAISVVMSNVSDVTGQEEVVNIYTTLLSNGELFYVIPVAPRTEYRNYSRAFQNVLRSIQLND